MNCYNYVDFGLVEDLGRIACLKFKTAEPNTSRLIKTSWATETNWNFSNENQKLCGRVPTTQLNLQHWK